MSVPARRACHVSCSCPVLLHAHARGSVQQCRGLRAFRPSSLCSLLTPYVLLSALPCCPQSEEFIDTFMKTAEKTWGEEQNAVYA